MKFRIINDALEYFNLGKLEGDNLRHAYGKTDKGIQVWLPIISEPKGHLNFVNKNNGEWFILERDTSGSTTVKKPDMITSLVITRDKKEGDTEYYYEYIGEYQQVFFDEANRFTIHAKVPQFTSGGISVNAGTLIYDLNFSKTDQEAQKKAADLRNEM